MARRIPAKICVSSCVTVDRRLAAFLGDLSDEGAGAVLLDLDDTDLDVGRLGEGVADLAGLGEGVEGGRDAVARDDLVGGDADGRVAGREEEGGKGQQERGKDPHPVPLPRGEGTS